MPIAGVLLAPEIVFLTLGALALTLYFVGRALADASWDATGFVEDVRNGLHNLIEGAIGWLRGWVFDVGNAIVEWAHTQVDNAYQWVLRNIEVVRNWADVLIGWANEIYSVRNNLQDAFIKLKDWIVAAHHVITTDLPAMVTGQIATIATWVNVRLGELSTFVTGELASVTTWVNTRIGELGTFVTGEIVSVRAWVDARFGDFGTWVTGQLVSVRQFVDAEILGAKAFASAVAAQAVAPVLDWIAGWQALLEWLRSVFPEIAAFLANPWAWLFAHAGSTLWYLVELWLKRVWDGDAYLPDP